MKISKTIFLVAWLWITLSIVNRTIAQSVDVNLSQNLSFGAFFPGNSGGSVIISPEGGRILTGGVIAFGAASYFPAIMELRTHPNRYISYILGPNAILTGSSGGSMTMVVGPVDKPNPFRAGHAGRSTVRIGGTLNVGNISANPPGTYSGTFTITFIEE